MRKHLAVMFLTTAMAVCGCQYASNDLAGRDRTPRPGEETPFGVAKGRRQISTWTARGGWKAIEPYADIISSVSAFGGLTREFVDRCHKADIEVYMPVGGDELAVHSFDTPGHAEVAVRHLVKRCDELGADGIDLDYECFESEWQERYTAFIVALANELHQRGKKLSICVNVLMLSDTGEFARYNPRVVGEVCDQVRVMCYDYIWAGTGRLGPTCTRPWAKEAMQAWMKFVPREKLIMGIPAYSHDQDVLDNSGRQMHGDKPPVPPSEIIKQGTLSYEGINYYVYRNKNQRLRVFYASDAFSVKGHLATVDELDIPAISFWTGNGATPEIWQAVRDWLSPAEPEDKDKTAPPAPAKAEPSDRPKPAPQEKAGATPAPAESLTVDLGDGVTMDLVLVRSGSFMMGSQNSPYTNERPPHEVAITKAFYIGKYEVTQEQWKAVMGYNPSDFPGDKSPVERVSWNSCQAFVKKLNEKVPEYTFRLPAEAEWEYACRAGGTSEFCYGDDEGELGEYAWYGANSGGRTHPVGEKKPNAWGLFDMHGNVFEWCEDSFEDTEKPGAGHYRVFRGGSFHHSPMYSRSADRSSGRPGFHNGCVGFRVAASVGTD